MPLLDASGLIEGAAATPVALAEWQGEPGVLVPNTATLAELLPRFADTALIAVDFPAFNDGRGFSIARSLRDHGYRGRLRASGNLIPDQFGFAMDCGFDEVEIDAARLERQPVEQWLAAAAAISVSYQSGGRTGASIFERRRAAA